MADDHNYHMEGVKAAFVGTNIEVVGYTTDPQTVLSSYKDLKPDVLLCDIRFKNSQDDGFSILKSVIDFDPAAKVIMFSQFDQDILIQQSYDEGAKCFLKKIVHSDELIEAITQVSIGEIFFTPDIAKQLAANSVLKKGRDRAISDILTGLEIEVLRYLAEGKTEKEIADLLECSIRKITYLKANLKEKLHINNNSDLTRLAIKHKLIDIDLPFSAS
jgi:two-component system, NarL family, invasion response regulator UvrY